MTFGATFAEYLRFQTKAYLYYESIHQPLNDSPSHTKPQPPQKPSYCYYPKRDLHFQVKGGKLTCAIVSQTDLFLNWF